MNLSCPACRSSFDTLFDAADFFHREIWQKSDELHREIHFLAIHYHWSEADILALPRQKRHLYQRLLAETLGGEWTQ